MGYSYWTDELWSVAVSHDNWNKLIFKWMLNEDVHPPLYQILLKIWMQYTGESEVATRSLSFIFAVLTLLCAALFSSRSGIIRNICVISFIGCSPLFVVYSQEARSYSMLLFFSTMVTGYALMLRRNTAGLTGNNNIPQNPKKAYLFYLLLILLSLTHYYGLIFSVIITAINLVDKRIDQNRISGVIIFLVMMIWPILHIFYGKVTTMSGDSYWNSLIPVLGTLAQFFLGTFPLIIISRWTSLIILLLFAFFLIDYVSGLGFNFRNFLTKEGKLLSPISDEIRYLLIILVSFLVVNILIDLHTPLSKSKNFIVLLPVIAFLFGDLVQAAFKTKLLIRRIAILLSVVLTLFYLHVESNNQVGQRMTPLMNYKSMGSFVTQSMICKNGCTTLGMGADLLRPYFPGIPLKNINHSMEIGNFSNVKMPLVGSHLASYSDKQLIYTRGKQYSFKFKEDVTCWAPKQAYTDRVFILLGKETLVDPSRYGLRKCGTT